MGIQAHLARFNFFPQKIEIFVWQLIQGRVLFRNVLNNFGVTTGTNLACPLCLEEVETIDHLFLMCIWSYNLWFSYMSWWEVSCCPSASILDWWKGWRGLSPKKMYDRAWCSLLFAVVWTTWESSNCKVFNNRDASLSQAVDTVKFKVVWWFKTYGGGSVDSITNMTSNIKDCCVEARGSKVPSSQDWRPPPFGSLFFNLDGLSRGSPGQAGVGGVLRDHIGRILCLFSANVGFQNAITAKILAIAKVIDLCITNPDVCDKDITTDRKLSIHTCKIHNHLLYYYTTNKRLFKN
ncbi:hypothetical protein Dsin_024428 [Dipteronia sinensis]|uniref:Reverse transcriptase zinc-binding domain-containing protein n=1 Tax=Dipteronia sinensis TaxID=43782 RepID=A0AAD9ZVB4_9ROSI|nr:hypothetical protein Dsin_024428 [Dipteronia sinensis]